MPYPFLLSYARADAMIDGDPSQPDVNFEAFLQRLNQRVTHLTGTPGFVDRTSILSGQDWPDELAGALRTAHTMVCLYSASYFLSEYCGKEMQVLLDRRREYVRTHAGKKPANIIPVLWHPTPRRIPKTLPDIEYKAPNLSDKIHGAWDLGDLGRKRELTDFADQIAIRVRDAADLTPLPALPQRPRMNAVRSAFLPPPLPLPEFDASGMKEGPDTVTFVYASSTQWNAWPWAPPEEQAVLHLASAVAKGKEMESTQLTFNVADPGLTGRLASVRRKNNVVILLVDAASLALDDLRACMQVYDRHGDSSFATIVVSNNNRHRELQARLDQTFHYFAKRPAPHFYLVEPQESFVETRDRFSDIVAEALEKLRLAIVRDPQAPNLIGNSTEFRSPPAINGP